MLSIVPDQLHIAHHHVDAGDDDQDQDGGGHHAERDCDGQRDQRLGLSAGFQRKRQQTRDGGGAGEHDRAETYATGRTS